MVVAPGATIELICTGPVNAFLPTWVVNGEALDTGSSRDNCYKATSHRRPGHQSRTTILMINGNHTCDTLNVYCRIYSGTEFLYFHNTTLTVQG